MGPSRSTGTAPCDAGAMRLPDASGLAMSVAETRPAGGTLLPGSADQRLVGRRFARRVRTLVDAHRHKTIATLRADGLPRISGIEAVFEEGPGEAEISGRAIKAGRSPNDQGASAPHRHRRGRAHHLNEEATMLVIEWWTAHARAATDRARVTLQGHRAGLLLRPYAPLAMTDRPAIPAELKRAVLLDTVTGAPYRPAGTPLWTSRTSSHGSKTKCTYCTTATSTYGESLRTRADVGLLPGARPVGRRRIAGIARR